MPKLGEPLAQRLQKLVEAAHRLDLLLPFLGGIFFRELLQPLGWDPRAEAAATFAQIDIAAYARFSRDPNFAAAAGHSNGR